jgi:hypothetical protein
MSLTEAVINYAKSLKKEKVMSGADRYNHVVVCGIWMVLGYWCQTAFWKFLWTSAMASVIVFATNTAKKEGGNSTWFFINTGVALAMTLNALIINWIMGTSYPTLNFILVCVLVANMSYFNIIAFKKTVADSGDIANK